MKNLVLFGLKGIDGRDWGLIVKDKHWGGGVKLKTIYGGYIAVSEVIIEPRLMGWDRLDWHWDAISRGGSSLWDCICCDVESFWYRLKIYIKIKQS
jgi:hypothetical protein